MTLYLRLSLAALLGSTTCWSAAPSSEKPRAAISAAEVTLDGMVRSDVARAMADAFSAAVLKKGSYKLYAPDAKPGVKVARQKKGEVMLGAAKSASAARATEPPVDVDYWFTFNLLGEQGRYALSVKKVNAKTQEVVGAQELAATGSLEKALALVPTALEKVEGKKPVLPFPMTQSPTEVRAALPISLPQKLAQAPLRSPGTHTGVPYEFADKDLTSVPKALVYRRVGSILATNQPWKFAIVQPADGKSLGVSDTVQVLWDDTGKTYSELRVANWDTGKVIADFGHSPAHHPLFKGDAVYGWAQPLW